MTTGQRKLVRYWVIGGSVILAIILTSFLEIEHQQPALLGLGALFGMFSAFHDFSYYKGYGNERKRMGDFIESHPKLKLWLVVFSMAVLPYFIYKMQTDDSVSGSYYFLSFLLLIGPIVYVSERERFHSLGD
ncbi:hypothetical protein [Methylomarinum vadi]|uniref:hypothetical protein n=1 Tax=Methylomarinum vadi TaxID=438855 RepID=UPI0004DF6A73|nr:hypothetical protein [Methylomarinum vadi]